MNTKFERVKVVIFDLGGTIVDDREFVYSAFCRVLDALGKKPLGRKEFDKSFSSDYMELYHKIGIFEEPSKLIKMFKEMSLRPDSYSGVKAYPDAKDVLQKLRHKFRLAIATSWRMDEINLICDATGIDKLLFDEIISHDHVAHLKPHPEPVELVARKLGVQTAECVMIGDTVSDIECGKAAGSKTIAVTWGTNAAEDLKKATPDAIVNDWKELGKLFL